VVNQVVIVTNEKEDIPKSEDQSQLPNVDLSHLEVDQREKG